MLLWKTFLLFLSSRLPLSPPPPHRGAHTWKEEVARCGLCGSSSPPHCLWMAYRRLRRFPSPEWGGADIINCITCQSAFIKIKIGFLKKLYSGSGQCSIHSKIERKAHSCLIKRHILHLIVITTKCSRQRKPRLFLWKWTFCVR